MAATTHDRIAVRPNRASGARCHPRASRIAMRPLLLLSTASLGPALPAFAADLAPPRERGVATALFRSCGDVGFVLTPVAIGALADVTSRVV